MKQSQNYKETYANELDEIKTLLKKYKCTSIQNLPVNLETMKILMWYKELSLSELERLSMDAFNMSYNTVFASICVSIFEKVVV